MPMMSYEAAAEALGINGESVRRMARRKKWRRQIGNDGKGLVEVPDEMLAERADKPEADPPGDREDGREDARALIARLEAELAGARELVSAERRRGDEIAERLATVERDRDVRLAKLEQERDQWIARAMVPWWKRLVG